MQVVQQDEHLKVNIISSHWAVIPRELVSDVDVWVHEFTEATIGDLIYDEIFIYLTVGRGRELKHKLTSLSLMSGMIYKGRRFKVHPDIYARITLGGTYSKVRI